MIFCQCVCQKTILMKTRANRDMKSLNGGRSSRLTAYYKARRFSDDDFSPHQRTFVIIASIPQMACQEGMHPFEQ